MLSLLMGLPLAFQKRLLPVLLAGIFTLLAGCGQQNGQVRTVPKEPTSPAAAQQPAPSAMADPHALSASLPQVDWTLPAGWQSTSTDRMEAARFKVGEQVNVSIIPLPSLAGKELQIVNLWRSQLQLSPATAAELPGQLKPVPIGDGQGEIVNLVSEKPLVDQKYLARITVGILHRAGFSWFIKMTGPDTLVQAQIPAFKTFLKSLKFHAAPAPSLMTEGASPMPAAGGASAGAEAAHPEWTVPQGWTTQPPGPMIMARYQILGAEGKEAEVTVSAFGGTAGGVLPNINRWRRQVQLKPLEEADLPKAVESLDLGGEQAKLVDMTSQQALQGHREPTRLVAVMVFRGARTWFFKLMGDASVAAGQKKAFVQFVKSVKFPHG